VSGERRPRARYTFGPLEQRGLVGSLRPTQTAILGGALLIVVVVLVAAGRRPGGILVCPPRKHTRRGTMSTGSLAARAAQRWEQAKLAPIGLHECRHTAATWLDAAGVSPKVASVLMGHATPDLQPGAAPITLARYTHTLPDAMEHAREQLDALLADRKDERSNKTRG
jgi:integrase